MQLDLGASHAIKVRRFAIYLPDKDRWGEVISDIEEWVQDACLLLTRLNGGVTRLAPAEGIWLNKTDQCLIGETVHIVYTNVVDEDFYKKADELRAFVHRFGSETNQENVVVEFDGVMYFVSHFSEPPQLELAV